jgi:protein-ribulosamine 3-kinase
MDAFSEILPAIAERLQTPTNQISATMVHGGSINKCFQVEAGADRYFCKVNSRKVYPGMFQAERIGLMMIAETNTVKVPACRHIIETDNLQCLLLEWIDRKEPSRNFWHSFGKSLAGMHATTRALPGFDSDNYMGSLTQANQSQNTWSEFFVEKRLRVQVSLAEKNKLLDKTDLDAFERLYRQIDRLMPSEPNVLLHGDLWSGNFFCDSFDQPVIFDPAVYYGLRHVDLAMTTLFGGFHNDFYEAYTYYSPLSGDYEKLWEVLNLYPLLIHLNLFGSSYRRPILNVLKHF